MDVDFAFICDHAEIAGKINALGIGFDTIYAAQVPVTHPYFHLVVQLRASVTEAGNKDMEVRLIDADGNDVIPAITSRFEVPRPSAGTEGIARIAVLFQNVAFNDYGSYSVRVIIQGAEMVRIPLRVAPPPQTA